MRPRFRLAALALLALSGVTCTDAPTALRHAGGPAMLSLAPAFSVQGMDTYRDLSSFGLTVDNIHIHIDHPPATPFDTTITVPAGADSVVLDLPIELSQTTETLNVQIELRHGSTVLYSGTQTVTATVGAAPSTSTTAVHVTYVGPGASVTQFAIAPRDTAILISGQVPFRVTATDDHGAAVPGVEIRWAVRHSSVGAVDQNTGIFSPSGATGSTYVVASLLNGLEDSAAVTVSAPPARLTLVSGGSQTGAAGSTLPAPLVVAVQDASGGPVAGVTVSFASPNGALLDSALAATDASGHAQTTVTLGHQAGVDTVLASAAGVPGLVVTEIVTAGAPAEIAKVSGDAQSDTVKATLPRPLVVQVSDAYGNDVPNAVVRWARVSGSGALAGDSSLTDASGRASVTYTLGATPGTDTVSATLAGGSGASTIFTAVGSLPAATAILKVSGDRQVGLVGTALAQPMIVKATDSTGHPVKGTTIAWSVVSGGGTVSPATSVTDSLGEASATLTLPAAAGYVNVNATLPDHAYTTFTEQASVPVVGALRFYTQPSNVLSATYINPPIQVEVLDGAGHRDTAGTNAGAVMALSVLHGPAGGHVRDSVGFAADTVQAVKGVATFHVGNDIAGTYTLLASASGLTADSSVAYQVSVGPAKHIEAVSPSLSGMPGDTTNARPTVLVTDAGGNPVANVQITWTADTGSGPVVNPAVPTTGGTTVTTTSDAAGKSSVLWYLGTNAYQSLHATISGGTDSAFFMVALTLQPSQIQFTNTFNGTYQSGTHVPLVVQVADANGQPVRASGHPIAVYLEVYQGGYTRAPAANRRPAFNRALAPRTGGRRPSAAIAPPPRPARPGAARAMAVGGKPSFSAMPYQSGVFDSLPYPPIPTLIGDTVVVTDSLGQAVFTNLNIAGYAGEAFDVVAWDTSSTNSLGSTYSPTMYLTAGAPYRVLAYYDSVHQAAGQPIVDAPELMVADSVGNGVASVPLTLSVTGGGALDSTHVTTDAGGYVSIPGWTLGTASGPNHIQATASTAGTPNAVTLTAFAHQPGALRVDVPPPTSIQDSAIFSPAVQVSVMDSTRTWFLNAPGDTIAPSVFLWPQPQDRVAPALIGTTTSVVTSASGAALFTGLGARGSLGSTIALGFSSTGLRSDTSALISVTAGPAANIAPLAGEALDSTHVEGTSTRQVQVVVTDTAGYPVGGASVTFQITGHSSGQCTLPNGSALQALTANAQGVASVNVSLPSSAASCVIQAFAYDQNSQILPGAPVNFREFVAPPNYDVWTGLADTSWTNAGNWSSGVPTASTSVFVPYFSTFQTWGGHAVGLAAPASVNSIDVENLADVELHNSPLYVYGNLDGVPQTAHAWGSFSGGTGYVEMMTPGSVIAESFPYKLAIGDTNMSCASANPVMVAGIDSAAVVEVNCPLAIANTANTWLTSQGDVNVQHHGTVQITGAATWLYVEGSLNITSDQSSKGLLTGGSIQVMGAGFSEDTVAGAPASYENFYSTGTGLLMENNPYGAQTAQTIRATSDSARFWSLSAANLSGNSAALSSTGAATYNVQNNLSVSSGNGVESFTIPSGVTLNAGGLSMGSTGRLYVNGAFNSASACDALQLPYIILGANGVITPASCHP